MTANANIVASKGFLTTVEEMICVLIDCQCRSNYYIIFEKKWPTEHLCIHPAFLLLGKNTWPPQFKDRKVNFRVWKVSSQGRCLEGRNHHGKGMGEKAGSNHGNACRKQRSGSSKSQRGRDQGPDIVSKVMPPRSPDVRFTNLPSVFQVSRMISLIIEIYQKEEKVYSDVLKIRNIC